MMRLKFPIALLCILSSTFSCQQSLGNSSCFPLQKISFAGFDKATALDETVKIYRKLWQDLGHTVSREQKESLLKEGEPLVIPSEFSIESDSLRQAFQELKELAESAGLTEKSVNDRLKQSLHEILTLEDKTEGSIKKELKKATVTPVIKFPNHTKNIRWSPNGDFVVGVLMEQFLGFNEPKTLGLLVHTSEGQSKRYSLPKTETVKDVAISNTGIIFLAYEDGIRTLKPLNEKGELFDDLLPAPFKNFTELGSWFDSRHRIKLSFNPDYSKIILTCNNASYRATSTDKENKALIIPNFYSAKFPQIFELEGKLYALEEGFQEKFHQLNFSILDTAVPYKKGSGRQISVKGLPRKIAQNSGGDSFIVISKTPKTLRVLVDFYQFRNTAPLTNPFELLEINLASGTGERIPIQGKIENLVKMHHPFPLAGSQALILSMNDKRVPLFYVIDLATGLVSKLADFQNDYSAQKFWTKVRPDATKYETLPNSNYLLLKDELETTQTLVDLTPYL